MPASSAAQSVQLPASTAQSLPQAPLRDLFAQVHSSEQGLTGQEARRRLAAFGFNEPASVRRLPGIVQFLRLFLNPLVAILLIASFISALLGDVISAAIIDSMVLLSLLLNYFQTARSQRAVEQLRAGVALTANVLRDGAWQEVLRRELVPGDVIRLQAGDLIPADARLLQATDLHVQQAALTGESMPVEKAANEGEDPPANLAEANNSIFLGTSVVSGTATALVIATGQRTAFGDIALRLAQRPPETEFERGIKHFSFLIMQTVFFLVFFVLLVAIARVIFIQHGRLSQSSTLEAILFAVSLAVGLTPEFLPMITTVTLGQGALRMAKRKVIVKHLESIQNFGSIDVLCSDKTGTLTRGQTALIRHLDLREQPSERILLFAYLNSFFETGIKSPFDAAILQHERLDTSSYVKLGEIPFDFERRRLSVVVEQRADTKSADLAQGPLLITKGAPESVLPVCSHYEVDGTQQPLDGAAHAWCKGTYQQLNTEGFRLLAVAYRPVPKQESYRRTDEQDLILLGFLAFADPPKEGVAEALQALRRDGVQVKILTGDNELVTRHVCSEVGLDGSRIVLGSELEHMSDSALASLAEQVQIFARVSPAQKNRIIMALKSRHHVVGFLGDGINDAPSLHAADVGISVADGVEVAKEAAAIILLEQSLQVLHDGIIEGRKAFGNVIKYLLMGTSSNFGNMFSMAGAFLFLPFLPMLPTQILLNNFLYDLSQVTIPTDNVDASFVRKPQRWNIKLIRDFMLFIGPISSIYDFLTFFVMLAVFHASESLFHTGWFVESLATQTLVLFIIRTAGNPLRSRPSRPLAITISLIVCIGVALPFTPLAGLLGFVPLPPLYFLFLVGVVVTYLGLVEIGKRVLMKRHAME